MKNILRQFCESMRWFAFSIAMAFWSTASTIAVAFVLLCGFWVYEKGLL